MVADLAVSVVLSQAQQKQSKLVITKFFIFDIIIFTVCVLIKIFISIVSINLFPQILKKTEGISSIDFFFHLTFIPGCKCVISTIFFLP